MLTSPCLFSTMRVDKGKSMDNHKIQIKKLNATGSMPIYLYLLDTSCPVAFLFKEDV